MPNLTDLPKSFNQYWIHNILHFHNTVPEIIINSLKHNQCHLQYNLIFEYHIKFVTWSVN